METSQIEAKARATLTKMCNEWIESKDIRAIEHYVKEIVETKSTAAIETMQTIIKALGLVDELTPATLSMIDEDA